MAPATIQRLTVDVDVAADLLGVSESTILRAIRAGTFPVPWTKVGRRIVINRQKLLDLIERGAS